MQLECSALRCSVVHGTCNLLRAFESYCAAFKLAAWGESQPKTADLPQRTIKRCGINQVPEGKRPTLRHSDQLDASLVQPPGSLEPIVTSPTMTKDSKLHEEKTNASQGFGGAVEKEI